MNSNPADSAYSIDPQALQSPQHASPLDPSFPLAQYSLSARAYNSAQKRQNSMSANANNLSNKRTPNPLQMQLSMQSNVPGEKPWAPAQHGRFLAPTSRRSTRKPLPQQNLHSLHTKTPTPLTYDVPRSPSTNQASTQNTLDSSGLSPIVEQPAAPASKESVNPESAEPMQQTPSIILQQLAAPAQRTMSDEEQQLATKLKETYKNIVNFEEIVQKSCIDLTIKINQNNYQSINPSFQQSMYALLIPGSAPLLSGVPTNTTELSNNLWTIYHHNVTLLNNYYDFLITALKPTANTTQFKTGKNIVDLYKIPRRMWVYGIVGFLEVLKNIMSIFLDHEIFMCFIAYCFSIVSNLTDPALESEGWWCEKLGDLSRMAIALYSSRFIDWKISAEYWYAVAMKTMYGHGKIYYHMCTVQQDNLDALVNIGKSVVCRDPFVPTQQYLRLVVENICTQRNILSLLELPIIDFIKIHKVLLSIHTNSNNVSNDPGQQVHDAQLQYGIDLVTRYSLTFGCDSHGYNFFTRYYCLANGTHSKYDADPFDAYLKQQHEQEQQENSFDTIEKMNFWFNKGALFAISNVNHLIGFGDPKNPFAKIFKLPEAIKERKDKKDRKRKSKSQGSQDEGMQETNLLNQSGMSAGDSVSRLGSELSVIDWFYCLTYMNKSVLELSFRILNHYLIGPKQASTCHVIVWLYFLIAVGESIEQYPNSKNMFLWLFHKFFPWESLINYLNTLVTVAGNNKNLNNMCCEYLRKHPNYIEHFNQLEFLPEVWKCWGTLWFDVIAPKQEYNDLQSAGIQNHDLFDMPICGTSPVINNNNGVNSEGRSKTKDQQEHDNDQRVVRIILLARHLADKYDFGLVRTPEGFRFDERIYSETESDYLISSAAPSLTNELFTFVRDVMYSDGRLVQNNFVIPISPENLVNPEICNMLSPQTNDETWFKFSSPSNANNGSELADNAIDEDDLDDYADAEYEDDGQFNAQVQSRALQQASFQGHGLYPQREQGVMPPENVEQRRYDDFYNENYVLNSDYLPSLNTSELEIEGDLGDRMDSSLTYITLDTNIWLKNCGRIYKCVRNGVFKVLIPLIVFQELRSLRKSAEATIADAATRSVIIIRELYSAHEIVPLRFDGTVASDINETTEFENNPNWMSNVDSTILSVVNEHDEIGKKLMKGLHSTCHGPKPIVLDSKFAKVFRYCILITDDRNMRLRAKTSGLTSFQSKWLFGRLEAIFSHRCID